MAKSEKTEWWPQLLQHINESWEKKKGRKYPFTGRELKQLKQLRGWLTAPEVMALWSVYLSSSPFWGPKTGWLLSGFWSERSLLLDDPSFKRLTAKYEEQLGMKEVKQVTDAIGLTSKEVIHENA